MSVNVAVSPHALSSTPIGAQKQSAYENVLSRRSFRVYNPKCDEKNGMELSKDVFGVDFHRTWELRRGGIRQRRKGGFPPASKPLGYILRGKKGRAESRPD